MIKYLICDVLYYKEISINNIFIMEKKKQIMLARYTIMKKNYENQSYIGGRIYLMRSAALCARYGFIGILIGLRKRHPAGGA